VLPLPMAVEGYYSPDSSHLAYVPFTNFAESWARHRGLKHYRGGTASPIWIAKLSDSNVKKGRQGSNEFHADVGRNKVISLRSRRPVSLYAL